MRDLELVRLETHESGVRILTLDRPPVNALGRELVRDIDAACARLEGDERARCLVLRSAGRHFSGGADLKERQGMRREEVLEFVQSLQATLTRLAQLPFPSIAAVRGAAVGGGCELALACDLRILAEDATVGLREAALAILPGAGGTQRLPRLIGLARAKKWIFTARAHSAQEALADGVAERVVPGTTLDHEAMRWAETISSHGPVAIRLAKQAIDRGIDLPLAAALQLEWDCYLGTLDTEDRVEGLKAFAEKRPPRYQGR